MEENFYFHRDAAVVAEVVGGGGVLGVLIYLRLIHVLPYSAYYGRLAATTPHEVANAESKDIGFCCDILVVYC